MNWYSTLRLVAFARRAVVALETIAASLQSIAKYAEDEWTARHAPKPGGRKVSFGTFDPQRASEKYEAEREFLNPR